MNLFKKYMQRVPCLLELVYMHNQLMEIKDEYKKMKLDRTSLLRCCKKEWHRMRDYFKKHPHKVFSVEDCSLYCQEDYCAYAAKEYSLRRECYVGELKKVDPDTLHSLGKKYPFSVCPLTGIEL
jgi:hypothetical protein